MWWWFLVGVWNAEMMLPNAAAEGMSLVIQIVDQEGNFVVRNQMSWAALPGTGANPSAEHPVVVGLPVYTDSIGNRVGSGRAYVVQLPVFVFPDAVAPGYDSAVFWIVDTLSWDTAGNFVVYDNSALTTLSLYSPDTLGTRPIHQALYVTPGKHHKGTVVLKNLIVFDTLYIGALTSDTVLYPTNYGYRQGIPFTLVVKDTVIISGAIVVKPGMSGGTWNNQVPSYDARPGANGDFITGRDGGGGSGGGGGSFGTQGSGDAGEVCGNPMLVPFMGGSAGGGNGTSGKDPSSVRGGPGGGFLGLISDGPVRFAAGSEVIAKGGNGWTGGDSYSGGGSGGGVYISGGVNNGVLILENNFGVYTPGGAPSGGGGVGGKGRVRVDGAVPDTVEGAFFAGIAMDSVWVCDTCSPTQIVVALQTRPNSSVLVYAYAVEHDTLFETSVDVGPSAEPLVPETLYLPAIDNDWHCVWAVNVGMVSEWTNFLYAYTSSGATEFLLVHAPTDVGEEGARVPWKVVKSIFRWGEPIAIQAVERGTLEVYSSSGALVQRLELKPGINLVRVPRRGVFYLVGSGVKAKVSVH